MHFTLVNHIYREVVMLKTLWDVIEVVKSSFNDWNTTKWQCINVEQMELDCKKFVKVREASHLLLYVRVCQNGKVGYF